MFIQQLINGITLGSIYGLISLGYTLVYGILMMINFAHSEIFMVGAFISLGLFFIPGINDSPSFLQLFLSLIAAMAGSAALGFLIEKIAYRPLRHASRLAPLISAIGVSIFLQNLIFLLISNQSLPYPELFPVKQFKIGESEINSLQLFIIFVSLFLMIALKFFIQKTRLGKALRATAGDRETAELLGINTNGIISLTFLIGGALGGAAGLLNGMYYGSIKYNMGFLPGIKAFTAAVLGGIGNITGAVLGGLIIGILESLGAGYIPGGSEWKDIFAFAILILVLLIRPEGLLGEKLPNKI
ncbi:MAG: ABC transporter permease [Elusimicrobia bacterium RIFCSPLOWO2_02_FULL_39_32]|nr:MAG: ABC transporter permease [Elusimicrobia bacterium GWA2_38_7]OGR81248.1 MAG: ABC transporter permease [Elusimicrobia bacterium RIFCSPHIGHO2_02_FULL_39_36]OGR91800.1 MAG: ABC transporter permease [Elusimicrobia bacterium RIFCSPLOWO2_02_FULL_39_32]OGR98459.1 MAG: ABC transporter permease [Elusimicrobia bacterium RIFCSPLOWO2_12_FULL_39_28]